MKHQAVPQWVGPLAAAVLAASAGLAALFGPAPASAAALCGEGSAPDYGFTADLQQPHWTVGWQGYASEKAVAQVDTILDKLNKESIAQTMILILPQDQVGNRTNCAVHFLRYMKLGEPQGERKDNGFVFLIVLEEGSIDVHYGVGLGLPALTAQELTPLNRNAEDAYQSTHDVGRALLTLAQGFDAVARANYAPLAVSASRQPATDGQPVPLALCGLLVMGLIVVLFLMMAARRGGALGQPGFGSRGGFDDAGGGLGQGNGGWSRGGFGGGRSSGPTMRGGSGSGRSGRGN